MGDTIRKEILQSVIVGISVALIGLVAEWLIEDEFWRSIVLISSLLLALTVLSTPYILRVLRSFIKLASLNNFQTRASIMHNFIHDSRDLSVRILGEAPEYQAKPKTEDGMYLANEYLYSHRDTIITLLEHMVQLFDSITPDDVKIWACIRDRRADDQYYTFARAGEYNRNRKGDSKPLHKDKSSNINRLKNNMRSGSCVIITGSSFGPNLWEPQKNDKYEEDKSVLMGAVLSKSLQIYSEKPQRPKMAFVLAVCANKENVFIEAHKPLMQACVDVFSIVANSITRAPIMKKGLQNFDL